jgi:hypothetical protein
LDHILASIQQQSFLKWTRKSFEQSLAYNSSSRTSSNCFRDVGCGNLFLTLASRTDQSCSMIFNSGDCGGQGRCWSSPSCSSYQLCEWGHCRLGKLHRCSEITSGSWDAPVHVLLCSNSVMKGKHGGQQNTEPSSVSMLGPGIPDCRLPWMFSKRKLFLTQGTAWRDSCTPT